MARVTKMAMRWELSRNRPNSSLFIMTSLFPIIVLCKFASFTQQVVDDMVWVVCNALE